jgi:hypothetical protein
MLTPGMTAPAVATRWFLGTNLIAPGPGGATAVYGGCP